MPRFYNRFTSNNSTWLILIWSYQNYLTIAPIPYLYTDMWKLMNYSNFREFKSAISFRFSQLYRNLSFSYSLIFVPWVFTLPYKSFFSCITSSFTLPNHKIPNFCEISNLALSPFQTFYLQVLWLLPQISYFLPLISSISMTPKKSKQDKSLSTPWLMFSKWLKNSIFPLRFMSSQLKKIRRGAGGAKEEIKINKIYLLFH